MNKHSNFIFILLFVVILGVGIWGGVVAGTSLFELAFPEETTSDSLESTSDSQSTSVSADEPVDQTPKKMIAPLSDSIMP